MTILEVIVYQKQDCLARVPLTSHHLAKQIEKTLKEKITQNEIVYKVNNDAFICLRSSEPFAIYCCISNDITIERTFQVLNDIEEKLFNILKRLNEFSVEAREGLHDYIEKLVTFHSDRTRRISKEDGKQESEKKYQVVELDIPAEPSEETKNNDHQKRRKRGRRTQSQIVSIVKHENKGKHCKIFLLIGVLFFFLCFIFSIYYCGGYSYQFC